jgi:hypothetical protein
MQKERLLSSCAVSRSEQRWQIFPKVMGDRAQLQQVMMNLITNSIDAMKDMDEPSSRSEMTTDILWCALAIPAWRCRPSSGTRFSRPSLPAPV